MSDKIITKCPSSGPTIACLGESRQLTAGRSVVDAKYRYLQMLRPMGAGHSDGNSASTKTRAAARFNVSSIPTLLLLKPAARFPASSAFSRRRTEVQS